MTPTYRAIFAAALLAVPSFASAQTSARITTAEIDGHLRFLSSDLLEGRAPATRGGRIAAEYIASQLRAAGVEPGANGSYFQDVPIDVVGADVSSITMTASGKATSALRYPEDVVVWAGSAADQSTARGELVFVGYGATAPEYPQLFIFVTAEESGLLGSAYFAENPTVPVAQIVANLNMDGGNLFGRTRDLRVLVEAKSSLGPQLAAMVRADGIRGPEQHPEAGSFYRSDHFSFAKAGVPAVSIGAGSDMVGRPKDWGIAQADDYTAHRYHQPKLPTWNKDAEFRSPRVAMQP